MVQSTENARVHSPYSVPRFVVRLYGKNVRPEFHISSSQKKKKKKKCILRDAVQEENGNLTQTRI